MKLGGKLVSSASPDWGHLSPSPKPGVQTLWRNIGALKQLGLRNHVFFICNSTYQVAYVNISSYCEINCIQNTEKLNIHLKVER